MTEAVLGALHSIYPTAWFLEKVLWIILNLLGLVLAAGAAAEATIDLEAVNILGERGSLLWTDTASRRLKAEGNRRDEGIKVGIHALLLVTGVIVSVFEEPITFQGQAISLIMAWSVIVLAVALIWGSYKTLQDRRRLWMIFLQEEKSGTGTKEQQAAAEVTQEQTRARSEHTMGY